jgi:hypothetical protein
MYGINWFQGTITSVYYYPQGGNDDTTPNGASTHIKFDHREDDIWLCGDQRSKFEVGNRYSMLVTFEANADCVTNWKVK